MRTGPQKKKNRSPPGALLNAVHQDGTPTTRRSSKLTKDSLRPRTHKRLVPRPGTELSRAQGGAWVRDYLGNQRGSAPLTEIYITLEAVSLTQHKMECTGEGQACAHSGHPFMLLSLQPSTKNVHFARKSQNSLRRHGTLSDHLRGELARGK